MEEFIILSTSTLMGVIIGFLLSWWKENKFYIKKSKEDFLKEQQRVYAFLYFDFKYQVKRKYTTIGVKNQDAKIEIIEKNYGYFSDDFRDIYFHEQEISRLLSLQGIHDFNKINKELGRKYNQEEMEQAGKEIKKLKESN